jgi:hypothetical protein
VQRLALAVAALATALLIAPASSQASTKWLCRPGAGSNPCDYGLKTTRISASGKKLGIDNVKRDRRRSVDCFYVYPTVSDQQTPAATKATDPEIKDIAIFQASRYSQVCRVFAPVYRQITIYGLLHRDQVTQQMRDAAYNDVVEAWHTYLKRYNKGRGVVLISHSQGSGVLRRLIPKEIDKKPSVRKKLVSAILLGGNVTVKKGSDRGGDFQNIRACHSVTQLGCVVAFSTFGDTPPDGSVFGRTTSSGQEVLCTNPASLGGGTRPVDTLEPSKPFAPKTVIGLETQAIGFTLPKVKTPWIEARGAYRAHCSSANGANVLRIAGVKGAPQLNALPDATWGLHLTDANIALGDLVRLVRAQGAAFARR